MKKKVIIILSVLLFFVLCPLLFVLNMNETVEGVRNYYNIVSSITSSAIGIIGLLLGIFYYFDKKRRVKIEMLLNTINDYDMCVKNILKLNISNNNDLKRCRTRIEAISDNINSMLDNKIKFIQCSDEEISKILYVNSIVDKSDIIMRYSYGKLKKIDRNSVFDDYEVALRDALFVCYGALK